MALKLNSYNKAEFIRLCALGYRELDIKMRMNMDESSSVLSQSEKAIDFLGSGAQNRSRKA